MDAATEVPTHPRKGGGIMKQLTREQAIAFCENKCYDGMTSRQIAEFQMEQDRLCVPFDVFHKAENRKQGI